MRLLKDPFVLMIAAVVLVPALLVSVFLIQQSRQNPTVNNASQEATDSEVDQVVASAADTVAPQPITQAEQPEVIAEKQTVPEPPVSACDEGQKQTAESTYSSQVSQENSYHQQRLDKIRLISRVYKKYWEDEMSRHQNTLAQIEATYQASLAAANC